ncbi:MAG: ion transporter [Acidisphaera sp.]|nr:ion transporter [Acidisphaera sp.]
MAEPLITPTPISARALARRPVRSSRVLLRRFYHSRAWTIWVGCVVFGNSIVLGLLTAVPEDSATWRTLDGVDDWMLAALVSDSLLCIVVKGRRVLRSRWDLFDITVTALSLVPRIDMLSALRVLRVLRVLRLLSFVPHGRATVDALFQAMRQMAAAFLVLIVVFYSFVIIATNLFRDIDPSHYGSLGRTATHLYAVMTSFGNDPDAIIPVVSALPWAWLVFVPFVVIASFGLLNLFIGVLAAAVKEQLDRENVGRERARLERLEAKLDALARALEAVAERQRIVPDRTED